MNTHLRRSNAQGECDAAVAARDGARAALASMHAAVSGGASTAAASEQTTTVATALSGGSAVASAGAGGAAGATTGGSAVGDSCSTGTAGAGAEGAVGVAATAGVAGTAGEPGLPCDDDGDRGSSTASAAEEADEGSGEPSSTVRGALNPANDIDHAVLLDMQALMDVSRHQVEAGGGSPARKRRRLASGGQESGPAVEPEYTYTTVATAVRAMYEDERDWERSQPLATRRKGWRTGCFNSFRLRAVERFALECDGGGLSLKGIEKLWELLDTWDGTKPGMPMDEGHDKSLRDSFKSVNAFKDAIHDDVDDGVLGAGWKKCPLVVDGHEYVVLFRPALQVILAMLKQGKTVRLWSGPNGPAPPSDTRESPMDGDAFRLNEAALMEDKVDDNCFVLGLHLFSDASQLSWSGGMCPGTELLRTVGIWCADRCRVLCSLWYGVGKASRSCWSLT